MLCRLDSFQFKKPYQPFFQKGNATFEKCKKNSDDFFCNVGKAGASRKLACHLL
jgi:hypothetical protein